MALAAEGAAVARGMADAARLLRATRLRDLLASIAEFWRASGPDRVWWRGEVMWRLQQWRVFHLWPERAAFQAAVSRTTQRRAV